MSADLFIGQIESINLKPRKKKKKSRESLEESVQMRIVKYLREQYPDVLYRADTTAGMSLSIGQAVKMKRLGGNSRNWPDFFIAEVNSEYSGLFLELKRDGVKIFKADGSLYKNEHHESQYETLLKLREKGYAANFAIGFEDAKSQIEKYLNTPK